MNSNARPSKSRTFRVFHGTDATFEALDPAQLGTANGRAPSNLAGFHTTDNAEVACTFGRNVLECELTLARPRRIDARRESYSTFKYRLNALLERIGRRKHDGVIVANYADAGLHADEYIVSTHFVAFCPGQVVIKERRSAEACS